MRNIFFVAGLCILVIGLNAIPSAANPLPESGLMFHVQPVSGSCETPITMCQQIVRWTAETGPLEFLLFFQPTLWEGMQQETHISQLHAYLTWPSSWHLTEFDKCGATEGTLQALGSPHELSMTWTDCPSLPTAWDEVFLVARFVLDTDGPGRIEMQYTPDTAVEFCAGMGTTFPAGLSAEVGADCEYEGNGCLWTDWCTLYFPEPELYLSAIQGGMAHGEAIFVTEQCENELTVDPRADWATAEIERINNYESNLLVTADATGLVPGTYETWIQVANGTLRARCLHVILNVGESTGVPDSDETQPPAQGTSWGRIKTIYR